MKDDNCTIPKTPAKIPGVGRTAPPSTKKRHDDRSLNKSKYLVDQLEQACNEIKQNFYKDEYLEDLEDDLSRKMKNARDDLSGLKEIGIHSEDLPELEMKFSNIEKELRILLLESKIESVNKSLILKYAKTNDEIVFLKEQTEGIELYVGHSLDSINKDMKNHREVMERLKKDLDSKLNLQLTEVHNREEPSGGHNSVHEELMQVKEELKQVRKELGQEKEKNSKLEKEFQSSLNDVFEHLNEVQSAQRKKLKEVLKFSQSLNNQHNTPSTMHGGGLI